jgi:hypothetical protein
MDPPPHLAEVTALALDLVHQPFGERVSEDEMIAHLIVPFFRSLGWQQEQIAVKWRHVDVALFNRLPRKPENCRLIAEAKHPGRGIEGARKQAAGYAAALQIRPEILVTDGYRYRLYGGEGGLAPLGYANLLRLKRSAAELFARLKRP